MHRFTLTLIFVTGLMGLAQAQSLCPAPDTTSAPDGFYNILPAGQGGNSTLLSMSPPHFADQLNRYSDLILGYQQMTAGDMTYYFKEESLYPRDAESTETPKDGVCIIRDSLGVPHIYGDTARDVAFGAGWATAEDHLFFADAIRHIGRARLSELVGPTDANIASDKAIAAIAGYSEDELQAQYDHLATFGDEGVAIQNQFQGFTDGMNAYIAMARLNPTLLPIEYTALQILIDDWKVTDIVATSIPVQAELAGGGGFELDNANLISTLLTKYPADQAHAIYRDLVNRNDPDAPVTIDDSFPYLAEPSTIDPAAVAIPDLGSVSTAGLAFLRPIHMSNFVAVTAANAVGGRPIAVMGPQVSYFAPEVLMELDLHGGGINARGATFIGLGGLVLLGRNPSFGWSATSGSSDEIDVRVEKLCDPAGGTPTLASTSYMFNGVCTPMYERTDSFLSKTTLAGIALPQIVTLNIERSVHGSVVGRATVNGQPVALARQRSTFESEVDTAVGFWRLNNGSVTDPASFFNATSTITGTFNWLYVSATDLAYYHSGRYPVRAPGVDPELPSWGTGEWEWTGDYVSSDAHPHAINPKRGWMTSWNNKPAHDWESADGFLGWSSIYRNMMLNQGLTAALAAKGKVDVVDMVKVMADAATIDLRGDLLLPLALKVMENHPEVAPWSDLLQSWIDDGAHRIDRDRDGFYDDDAAIALFDAWYPLLVHAIFDAQLDGVYDSINLAFDDGNRAKHLGSSFADGWYGWVQKALEQSLGTQPGAPFVALMCGDGTQEGCAELLVPSLLAAVASVSAEYGPDPTGWHAPKVNDQIQFDAIGLTTVPPIDWQNRPTFQQVVQFTSGPVAIDAGPEEPLDAGPVLPSHDGSLVTGGGNDAGGVASASGPNGTAGCAIGAGSRGGVAGSLLLLGILVAAGVRRRRA